MLAWQVRNKKVLVIGGGEVRPPPPLLNQARSVDINKTPRSPPAES